MPATLHQAPRRSQRPNRTRRRYLRPLVGLVVLVTGVGVVGWAAAGGKGTSTPRLGLSPPAAPAPPTAVERARASAARARAAEDRAIERLIRGPGVVTSGAGRRRAVALTFDDGPGPSTLAVIDVLRRFHAPATFFQIGQSVPSFRRAARAVRRAPFVVGDHTQSHPMIGRLSPTAQRAQIRAASTAIRREEGLRPRLFRPPYGSYNRTTRQLLRRAGMLMVLWSVDSNDYRQPGVGVIVQRVLSAVHPGAIVLMHDAGGPRGQTVAALPRIIRALRRRGFELVTVPQLLAHDPPRGRQPLPQPGVG